MPAPSRLPSFNHLQNLRAINHTNVDFRLSTLKKMLRALRTCESGADIVSVKYKNVAPGVPDAISNDYSFKITKEVTLVFYNDRWHNNWFVIPIDKIPESSRSIVLDFIKRYKEYLDGDYTNEVNTSLIDYFTRLCEHIVQNSLFPTSNKDIWNPVRSGHISLHDFLSKRLSKQLARRLTDVMQGSRLYSKSARDSARMLRRELPKELRGWHYYDSMSNACFNDYINDVANLPRYGKKAYYSSFSGSLEIENVAISQHVTDDFNRRHGHIPLRYLKTHHVSPCACCNNLQTQRTTLIYEKKHNLLEKHAIIKQLEQIPEVKNYKNTSGSIITEHNPNQVKLLPIVKRSKFIAADVTNISVGQHMQTIKNSFPGINYLDNIENASEKENKPKLHPAIKKYNTLRESINSVMPTLAGISLNQAYVTLHASCPNANSVEEVLSKYVVICYECYNTIYGRAYNSLRSQNGNNNQAGYFRTPFEYMRSLSSGVINNYSANPLAQNATFFLVDKMEKKLLADGVEKSYNSRDLTSGKITRKVNVDKTPYLGIELEVTPSAYAKMVATYLAAGGKLSKQALSSFSGAYIGNSLDGAATGLTAFVVDQFLKIKRSGIIKSDSSVVGGFEIVSNPGTHLWHTTEGWNGFFKEDYDSPEEQMLAPSAFLLGWVNNGQTIGYSTCGIHIHLSKASLTPLQAGRMNQFFNAPENSSFIYNVAGRRSDGYAPLRGHTLKAGYILTNKGSNERFGRDGLNMATGKPTVEFRIFQSNVAKLGFMKNIDFVHAFASWAAIASNNDLKLASFLSYVNYNRGIYKYFNEWLDRKGYYKYDAKNNPKNTFVEHKPIPEYYVKKIIDIDTLKPAEVKIKNPNYKPYTEVA